MMYDLDLGPWKLIFFRKKNAYDYWSDSDPIICSKLKYVSQFYKSNRSGNIV